MATARPLLLNGSPTRTNACALSGDGNTIAMQLPDGNWGIWRVERMERDNEMKAKNQRIGRYAKIRDAAI
jgi:hypothetical protein